MLIAGPTSGYLSDRFGARPFATGGVLVAAASFALLMLAPLMVLLALAVKATSRGPVLFRQRRYGLNGEEILIYKFRSMRVMEDGAVVTQATKTDSRVTPLGRILRSTSLDELPQLINVLEGKMSVVGPRPHAVAHNEQYRKLISGYMIRHKVRPGITGWAQLCYPYGSSEQDALEKLQYDLYYIKNSNLLFDLAILAQTLEVVVMGKGAR